MPLRWTTKKKQIKACCLINCTLISEFKAKITVRTCKLKREQQVLQYKTVFLALVHLGGCGVEFESDLIKLGERWLKIKFQCLAVFSVKGFFGCCCFSVSVSGGETVQKKTRSLRFNVIFCSSYSLAGLCAGNKAEDEQGFFKLIKHRESLYSGSRCKVV